MMTSGCAVDVGLPGEGDAAEDVARRLAMTLPGDSVRGSFFLGTLEVVGARVGPEAVRRCMDAGGEPRFLPFFNYPLGAFLRLNAAAAWELAEACGGWDEAQRRLGERAAADLLATAAGRALLLSCREPERLMNNLPAAFRAVVSHGERSVLWEGTGQRRIIMRRDFMPCSFHEGLLRGALETTGARQVRVRGARIDVLDSEYMLRWE